MGIVQLHPASSNGLIDRPMICLNYNHKHGQLLKTNSKVGKEKDAIGQTVSEPTIAIIRLVLSKENLKCDQFYYPSVKNRHEWFLRWFDSISRRADRAQTLLKADRRQ